MCSAAALRLGPSILQPGQHYLITGYLERLLLPILYNSNLKIGIGTFERTEGVSGWVSLITRQIGHDD